MGWDEKYFATKDFYAQLKDDVRTDFYDLRERRDSFKGVPISGHWEYYYLEQSRALRIGSRSSNSMGKFLRRVRVTDRRGVAIQSFKSGFFTISGSMLDFWLNSTIYQSIEW